MTGHPTERTAASRHDAGIAGSRLLTTLVILGVLVIVGIDLVRPFLAQVSLDDTAKRAVLASSAEYKRSRNDQLAQGVAQEEAAKDEANLVADSWSVRANDATVTLTVEKKVSSIILGRIFSGLYELRATATDRS